MTSRSRRDQTIFFTGFPGFLGLRLLPRLLELKPHARVACLVQGKFRETAREGVAAIEKAHPHARGRLDLVTGDITRPGLGLDPEEARSLHKEVTEGYHLAAVYDLAVKADLAHRINVLGTRHVLEWLGEAKRFERLHYVSTAFVSGTARGLYRETDLDVGQGFKNHYERTKFQAEVEVAKSGLPRTIYRPGIVVGDSRTGETGKFDGPYFILRFMERLPSPGVFMLPGGGRGTANVVPVDFVVEALARLSTSAKSAGKTYHLTDPDPLSPAEIARLFARVLGKSFVFLPVPMAVAKAALWPVHGFLGMPLEALDYFDDPVRHDATVATRDLGALGISCPRLPDYTPALVAFYRAERDRVRREAMV
jgi:thioester reductase-like protein